MKLNVDECESPFEKRTAAEMDELRHQRVKGSPNLWILRSVHNESH